MRRLTARAVVIGGLAVMLQAWCAPAAWAGPSVGTTELLVFGGTQHDGAQFSMFGVELLPWPGLEESSFAVGLNVTRPLSPRLGIELDASYDPRLGEPFEAAVTTATAGVVYHVNPTDRGVLYLAAGAGAAWFHAADGGGTNDLIGVGAAAIGVKIYLGRHLLLRVDFRYFYAPSPFTDQDLLRRSTIGIGARF
jgi:hypothetical protein